VAPAREIEYVFENDRRMTVSGIEFTASAAC
jgi:hypothetical protein